MNTTTNISTWTADTPRDAGTELSAGDVSKTPADPGFSILCVDDEPGITSALRRLFRPRGYRVHTAQSGRAGLDLLAREYVDVVISDMRMPEMNGAQFLEQVKIRHPEAVRLLLTGYADIASTVGAINRGEIHRYIAKPWDDHDIVFIVQHALDRAALAREKLRLEALTREQNEELRQLNATLESSVAARTRELAEANEQLKVNFVTSLKVFTTLIELREGSRAGHSRRVADLARRLAIALNLGPRAVQDVFLAGLLHDVGRIGLPEPSVDAATTPASTEQRAALRKYPLRSEQALLPLPELRAAARIVRSHRERHDGGGFPEALKGEQIPIGARILAAAKDCDALMAGLHGGRALTAAEAATAIMRQRGKRYDPRVADALAITLAAAPSPPAAERSVTAAALQPGMVLARDLIDADGVLLLGADSVLDTESVRVIGGLEASADAPLAVWVRTDRSR